MLFISFLRAAGGRVELADARADRQMQRVGLIEKGYCLSVPVLTYVQHTYIRTAYLHTYSVLTDSSQQCYFFL